MESLPLGEPSLPPAVAYWRSLLVFRNSYLDTSTTSTLARIAEGGHPLPKTPLVAHLYGAVPSQQSAEDKLRRLCNLVLASSYRTA